MIRSPRALPLRSAMRCTLSLAISSKQPVCTPVSILIGTPASIRRMCIDGMFMSKSVSPRTSHCELSTFGSAWHVLHVGQAVGAHQLSGKVDGAPAVGAILPAPQAHSGRFRGRLSPGLCWSANKADSAGCHGTGQEMTTVLDDLHRNAPLPELQKEFRPEPSKRGSGRGR